MSSEPSKSDGQSSTLAVQLEEITKRFPGVVANDDVDLHVERGTVHALLGENGAGKTTLMNVLYGLYSPSSGQIRVNGEERTFSSPRDAIRQGIGMIHQHFMLIDPMTVTENITLGAEPRKWGGLAIDRARAKQDVTELCETYGLSVDLDARIEEIGVGSRQRVEILKALYRGTEVLILDEPTAVLTPQEVTELFSVFEELTAEGKTIIFITHKLGEALHAADTITVLRDGHNAGVVPAAGTSREELARMMVGRELLLDLDSPSHEPGETVLTVDGLTVRDERDIEAVSDVSFTVRAGEVFAIAGVDGNGQSELIEAITGIRQPENGTIELSGADVTTESRRERIDRDMAYIPEDRQESGLIMKYDLTENAILGSQHKGPFATHHRAWIDWKQAGGHAQEIIEEYDVKPRDPNTEAASLSGGNQQKFVVGREFERDPELVVASHPTRGVDIGSTGFIHDQLLSFRESDRAVCLVSSKLEEVKGLSDRLAVMYEGEFMACVDPNAVTEEEIGLLMAGEYPDDIAEKRIDCMVNSGEHQ